MDKGAELNKRVWTLFQKAGFETNPNSDDPTEFSVIQSDGKPRPIDLLARVPDLGVTIVGSNKSRKKLKSVHAHFNDFEVLKRAAGANGALFVAAEQELPVSDRTYAHSKGIHVWDSQQLAYYEAVVDALGSFAKYEMIHALGIPTKEEALKDTVIAIRLHQPRVDGTEMYMFTQPADKLLKTCVVLRRAEGSAFAYQRILSKKRLPKVGAFVGTPEALLPTNIVVHLGEDITVDEIKGELKEDLRGVKVQPSRPDHQLVAIELPLKYGSMELIDGQHRLFGFVHADESIRKNFSLVVLGLRKLSEKRKSHTFIAINDNARRVDPNLVAFLRHTDDEKVCRGNPDLMAIKIVVELNRLSPFKDSIRMLDVGHQRLTLKGLSGYDLRGIVGPKGLFRRFYPENSSKRYVRVLRTYYSVIKAEFTSEWEDPDTYIVATNRGFTAFLKLMKSILKTEQKRMTKMIATKYIKALRRNWSAPWETAKLKASYVGSQGWKRFHRDMVKAIQKKYKTFQG